MYSARQRVFGLETIGIIAVALLLALALNPYQAQIAALTVIFAMAGIGLNILIGYSGLVSLGHVVFFAIGAYGWAKLSPAFPVVVALVVPILISVVIAVAIVAITLRVVGYYFGITTLAIGLLGFVVVSNATELTGGYVGIRGIQQFGMPWLSGPNQVLLTAAIAFAVCYFLQSSLRASPIGMAMVSTRFDIAATQSLGISVTAIKFVAFAISAVPVTVAGAFLAQLVHYIGPDQFTLATSINLIAIAIVGGRGWRWAPLLGAVVIVTLPEILRPFAEYRLVFSGAVLTFVSLFMPQGLAQVAIRTRGLLDRLRHRTTRAAAMEPAS